MEEEKASNNKGKSKVLKNRESAAHFGGTGSGGGEEVKVHGGGGF